MEFDFNTDIIYQLGILSLTPQENSFLCVKKLIAAILKKAYRHVSYLAIPNGFSRCATINHFATPVDPLARHMHASHVSAKFGKEKGDTPTVGIFIHMNNLLLQVLGNLSDETCNFVFLLCENVIFWSFDDYYSPLFKALNSILAS